MSDLQLINRSVVPPGQFRYVQSETQFTIISPTWLDLVKDVKKHRIANNLPVGLFFEHEIESQLAESLSKTAPHFVTAYEPPPKIPVPREEWPLWAKGIALIGSSEDKGVGDTIYRVIGDENSETFKTWYRKIFGKDCSCATRRWLWNELYSYAAE